MKRWQPSAGIPVDGDFDAGTPARGICVVDSSNNRAYFRVGSTWKYAASRERPLTAPPTVLLVRVQALGRVAGLGLAAIVLGACIGRLSLAANITVEPHLVLPGNRATLAIDVEGDGLLGNAIRQQLTPAAFQQSPLSGAQWELRDNSDAQSVRFRAVSTTDFPATLDAQRVPAAGAISLSSNDYVLFRRYQLQVTVPPTQSTTPTSTDQLSQQTTAAALAAVRYDWTARLPGSVETTNGVRSDDGRIVWHLDISAKQAQVLTAQSTYIDFPRIALVTALLLIVLVGLTLSRRRTRPPTTGVVQS